MKSSITGEAQETQYEVKDKFNEVAGQVTDNQKLDAKGEAEIRACSWKAPSETKMIAMRRSQEGKIGWVLLWALGIPIPLLVALYLLRGCT